MSTESIDVSSLPKRAMVHGASSRRVRLAPTVCAGLILVMNIAFYSRAAPVLRLVELSVCREYFSEHDPTLIRPDGYVDEILCKVDSIQTKVAWLFAADELLHFCCDFIATLPLGFLADRTGPKPVMLLNFGGFILSWAWTISVCIFYETFSVNWVLLASVFNLLGGASHVMTALVYSEAALYTTDRTTTFSILEGIIQVSQLVGPIIGSSLLLLGIYVPYYFIFPLALVSIPLTLCLPHVSASLSSKKSSHANQDDDFQDSMRPHAETEGLLAPTPRDSDAENEVPSYSKRFERSFYSRKIFELFAPIGRRATQFYQIFRDSKMVRYSSGAMLVVTLGKQALHILLQYVSKRFGVSIAEAGFLFSVKAVVVLVLYALVIPFAYRTLSTSKNLSDLRLARLSIVSLFLGTLWMGLSWNIWVLIPGLIIYASGFGFPVVVRSMATSAASVDGVSIPLLYSGLAIAETAGSFIGATVLTAAFTSTLKYGGIVSGVPFFICSIFYGSIALPTWFSNIEIEERTED